LYGHPKVNYQQSEIIADSLFIDLKKERAYSFGPTRMRDGDQLLLGSAVSYDVGSQTGMLNDGYSMMEKGYYSGTEIRKIDADIYDIDNGRFTNCDLEEPAFWFSSKQLRVYRGDKIVGKPVIAYVNHFPVFYFPFISIPIRKGRYAGFLIPEPGYNATDGKYLRDIAWYYPYKDYADFIVGFDLMEKTGWKARAQTSYLKRYFYNGALNATFHKGISPAGTNNDWALQGNHHHELPNQAALDVNLDYISNKRIWEDSYDLDQSLAQQLSSSISYRKPLGSSYLNVGSVFTQDLVNDRASISLPSATFSLASRPVTELFGLSSDNWLSNLSYNYGARLEHTGELRDKGYRFGDLFWDNSLDPADTTGVSLLNEHHLGIRQSFGLSYNWKYRGWLNMREGVDMSESWMDRDKKDKKFVRGGDYAASINGSFNLYGMRTFANFPVTAIRHIMTPTVGFSYLPDSRANADLYTFGGIGVRSGDKAANMNFSLDNKWQLKYKQGSSEKRLNDIFTLSSRASANLYKADHKFSTLSHSLNFRPGSYALGSLKLNDDKFRLGKLSLGYSSQFSLQQNPYLVHWEDFNLSNQYFSQSIALSGAAPYQSYFVAKKNQMFDSFGVSDSLNSVQKFVEETASDNAWSLSLVHDLYAPKDIFRAQSSSLRLGLTCKITNNWGLSYTNYYNVTNKDMISQSFHLIRDLHCWKLDISINHRNEYWDYRIIFFNTLLPDALRFQTRDSKTN
jgi:lipopolysaccharide assembly outer membrane protein LptD (OstA)